MRLPMLLSEGVGKRSLSVREFVALTATNHAKMYGLYPQNGTIAVGSDADLAIWDPDKDVTITCPLLHHQVGYTPYQGRPVRARPVTAISRRRAVVEGGQLKTGRCSGKYLPCA